jgi:hypothetical protein
VTAFAAWDRIAAIIPPDHRRIVVSICLIVTFAISSLDRSLGAVASGTVFVDLRIYRLAAAAALAGEDPWSPSVAGFTFAGPPPSLVAYLPAALLPETLAIALYLGITIVASVAVLRWLRVPLWWLIFPPLLESILVINADVVVVALLVGGGRWAALAPVLKVYALVPLAIRGRWREAVVGGVLVALAGLPLWIPFLEALPEVNAALAEQSFGGLSAWGTWLMIPVVIALIVIGRDGASWLAVPALWPSTQLHYSALALPVAVRSPVVAFLLSFAVWPLPAIAAIAYAGEVVIRRWRASLGFGPPAAPPAQADPRPIA